MLSYAWIASDINPAGVAGEASRATADKGRQTAEAAVAAFVELLEEVERSGTRHREFGASHARSVRVFWSVKKVQM